MGGSPPIWRAARWLFAVCVVATTVLLAAAGADARTKFIGKVVCAPGGGRATVCFEGDLPTAIFQVWGRDHVRYRVCVTPPSGSQFCDSRETKSSGSRSSSRIGLHGLGKYTVTWTVRGHVKAQVTYKLKSEGV